MSRQLSSAERVKLTYARQEADRVPVMFRAIQPLEGRWRNQVERAEGLLAMGADASLQIDIPIHFEPRVTTETWTEKCRPHPVLHKEYHTPAGTLHASVQLTEDWQPEDIPLYSDHAWSRGVDFLIETEQDLNALHYLLRDPAERDLTPLREYAAQVRKEADRLGVIVQGNMPPAPLYMMGLLGGRRCLMGVRDEPELLVAVIVRIQQWTRQCLEVLLQLPIDVVYRSNCYETIDLFSPTDVRDMFMPILQLDVELCHRAGLPIHCFAQTGIMPFLEEYADMGVDIISSLDPVGANRMDPAETKRRIGDRCCLMGGVDNRAPFTHGTPEQMERLVAETLEVMAPCGGYILSPAGMIFPEGKEENIRAFVDAARRQ